MTKGQGIGSAVNNEGRESIRLNSNDIPKEQSQTDPVLEALVRNMMSSGMQFAENTTSLRRSALNSLLNPGKDIYFECGYPVYGAITEDMYKEMYDREGLGTRVVQIMPDESWALEPEIVENEDTEETAFEKQWKELNKKHRLYHYLHRGDVLSGIGEYGILLLGINDGMDLHEPVEGINLETEEKIGNNTYELLYLRAFDETSLRIDKINDDKHSPRFGFPELYDVKFSNNTGEGQVSTVDMMKVHWTRVIHLADNRHSSEVFGIPRMRPIYNRLLDVRKIVAGSGEMFWKGGFPGYAFETLPEEDKTLTDTEVTALRSQIEDYAAGLQRYLTLGGMTVKSLSPQVSDPKGHIEAQVKYIAITLGIPYRIFMGSEQAQLAAEQDVKSWIKRISKRRENYLTPFVVRSFIDRLMLFGVLDDVEDYNVIWPDLSSPSDSEQAEVADKRTAALAKYVAGGVDALIPPKEYLTMVAGFEMEETEAIEKAAEQFVGLEEPESEPVVPVGGTAVPESGRIRE